MLQRHVDADLNRRHGAGQASPQIDAAHGDPYLHRTMRNMHCAMHQWRRANHFTGGAITGAVSIIDIALWDIKGKMYGRPVYELLGGKMRHKARIYGHVKGRTIETLLGEARRLKADGFTKLGHLNPLLGENEPTPYYKSRADKIETAIDNVRRLREAVRPSLGLCIESSRSTAA